jgi:hypothetical protein
MRATIAGVATTLALALPATAQAYSGPWDSAHQPPTVSNPGVVITTTDESSSLGNFTVALAPTVGCTGGIPTQVQVTFSAQGGIVTDTLSDPCTGGWDDTGGSSSDSSFFTSTSDAAFYGGSGPSYWAGDALHVDADSEPFVYTVAVGGAVIAQGAYTASVAWTAPWWVPGSIAVTTVTPGGWPAPPFPGLSRDDGLSDIRSIVKDYSRYPVLLTLTGCVRTNGLLGWACRASWLNLYGTYQYRGKIHVWEQTPYAQYFYASGTLTRTDPACVDHCTSRRIAVR